MSQNRRWPRHMLMKGWVSKVFPQVSILPPHLGCSFVSQNVPFGMKACPPGVKEFPFVVKDGCVFFGACLAPCLKRVCARFCGGVATSRNPPEGSDALATTKEQKSLLYSEKDISDLSYGAIPEPKKPEVLNVPGSISDKANPFHGTNF